MDRSWFDDGVDLGDLTPPRRRGLMASSRWTTSSVATSVSHQLAFLEESRTLDMQELQATSARLRRESSRLTTRADQRSNLPSSFVTRRMDLAQRFNDLMRTSSGGTRYQLTEDDSLNRDLQAIKDENLKLQAVISDVTEVNKRWQKYNNDRQMYVQRLLTTIQDQQEQMNRTIENRSFLSSENMKGSMEDSGIICEKLRLEEELAQQRRRLDALEKEYREHVAVLEFQVKAHHDDWEMERSEKQQVLKDKLAAEAKVRQLQKDVRCLKLKLREERLENANHCSCCSAVGLDPGLDLTSAAKLNSCRRDLSSFHSKTYRTSVHLPCTSGNLLPRGTTLIFGEDDVGIDNEEIPAEVSKNDSAEGREHTKNSCMEESSSELKDVARSVAHKKNSKSRSRFDTCVSKDNSDGLLETSTPPKEKVKQSYSQPNLTTSSATLVSCSVLHINPSQSISTASIGDSEMSNATEPTSGVTIGFSSNGLASVFSFPQAPIVKSYSLPASTVGAADHKTTASQPSSLSSSRSTFPITSSAPDTCDNSTESLFPEKKSSKLSLLGAFAKSMKESMLSEKENSKETVEIKEQSSQKTATWKAKYFEDGVATQTKEDIICPSCGQIFPPLLHVKFLDHFEECQTPQNVK